MMQDRLQQLSDAERARIKEIAQELANFGLGISAPHKHAPDGTITALPENEISFETDQRVSFLPVSEVPAKADAVGWRFAGGKLSVFAGCCGQHGD
jgi:hypothetical protein